MKRIPVLSLLLILISCGKADYELDFSNLDFPENSRSNDASLDSILELNNKLSVYSSGEDYTCQTDKTVYLVGEEITLTVKNNTSFPLYFFPDEMEGARSRMFLPDDYKESFKKNLVSQNPAITGFVMSSSPSFVCLYFGGIDEFIASEMGLNAFKEPLEAGKSMTFQIVMPDRTGHYQFSIARYAHEPEGFGLWGLNNFLMSNTFQIVDQQTY